MFLLQLENNGHYSSDVASVAEKIEERNWLYPNDKLEVCETKFENLNKDIHKNMIPVGSIEFVNQILSFNGKENMKPVNVPKSLMQDKYLLRKVEYINSKNDVLKTFDEWNTNSLFIKSNSGIKTENTDIYKKTDNIFDDTSYFVSEVVDFISEWRCFVYREQARGIKNYLGDEWILPTKDFIMDCISKIGKSLTAYTFDVGILPNGKTAIIEVHNFVSCGLYGFENNIIIPMIINGYKTEFDKKNK